MTGAILIDIAHPAHVHFFRPLAQVLLSEGFDVHIVARDKDVTVRLIEASGLPFEVIAMRRSGAGRLADAVELIRRTLALRSRIRRWEADVVLTRNPSGVLAAVGTSARSVFDTDDGQSVGMHYWLARPFADVITSSMHDPESHGRHHRRYRALKAHLFLHPKRFSPNIEVRRRYLHDDETLSVVRFSAHDASHDRKIDGLSVKGKEAILSRLSKIGPVLLSVENGGLQLIRRGSFANDGIQVPPEEFHDLLATANLFVGDSQSVAAEAAILGVPSLRLSGFSGKSFYLRLLESHGLMRNFSPHEEAGLLSALDSAIGELETLRARCQVRATALNDASEDILLWFVQLIRGLSRFSRPDGTKPQSQWRLK